MIGTVQVDVPVPAGATGPASDAGRYELIQTSAMTAVLPSSSWAWSFHTFAIWDACRRLGWKRVPGVDVMVEQEHGIDTYSMTR